MLKKEITYTDFNGEEQTKTFYFNLNKAEITELELSEEGGLVETIERISSAPVVNGQEIIRIFKKIILLSYGVKSEDGQRFIKSPELTNEFVQTNAYSELFVELASDADAASAFITGIVPKMPEKQNPPSNKLQNL